MALHYIFLIAISISLIAIFMGIIPFLKTLYEDYGKPDWGISETVDERLEELIEKYNVPTELQKNLGAVTDKYFLIKGFPLRGGRNLEPYALFKAHECWYYRIYSRRPDGTLGERKGNIALYENLFVVCESENELNEMCDAEVQAEPLKRRRRVMQDRFTSL